MIILLCSLCKCRAFVGPRIFGVKAMMVIINNRSVIFIVLDKIYCFVLCVMPDICLPEDNWGRRQ